MTKLETLAKRRKYLKPFIDEGLKWAKKYYIRLDKTTAYIVAMCKCGIFSNGSKRAYMLMYHDIS
jgi:hypothetical protein